MTPSFEQQMSRMNGLKFVPSDLTTHWEALNDLPYGILVAAVTHAQRACVDFPTPFELRSFADLVRSHAAPVAPDEDRTTDIATPVQWNFPQANMIIRANREWNYYCDECSDTGRRSIWCGDKPSAAQPWIPVQRCGNRSCLKLRRGCYTHEWVESCGCVSWNPWLKRQREQATKYAAERAGKKS